MNDVAAVPVVGEAEPRGLSQIERVVDAYIAPSKTFTDIRRSASWWLPFLLVLVISLIGSYMLQTNIGWSRMAEQSMKGNARFDQATPEQQQQQIAMVQKTMPVFSYALYPLVIPLVFGLIIAGINLGVFNFALGGHAGYWQLFAVYFYASLPGLLKAIIFILTVKFGDPDNFNLKNPVGTNIGFYLPAETPHWLMVFFTQIDLFTIWILILMGIGCAIVAGVKRSTGMIAVFAIWAIYVICATGIAAI
jgi:hypothetical protein